MALVLMLLAACTSSNPRPEPPRPSGEGMLLLMKMTAPACPRPCLAGYMAPGTINGTEQVYLVRPDGTGLRLVYTSKGIALHFSASGPYISFIKGSAMYRMSSDDSGVREVMPDCNCYGIALSPDGSQIAFERATSVFVVRADGTNVRQLTRCSPVLYPGPLDRMHCAWLAGAPTWSPDGSQIAYAQAVFSGVTMGAESQSRQLYGAPGLYEMSNGGTGLRGVTSCTRTVCPGGWQEPELGVNAPAWSPTSGEIAYVSSGSIVRMRTDGSGVQRLYGCGQEQIARGRSCVGSGPFWSPDGQHLAFTWGTSTPHLLLIRRDGTQPHIVPLPETPRTAWQVIAWVSAT